MIVILSWCSGQNVDGVSWVTGDDGLPVPVKFGECLFNEYAPECRILMVYTCKDGSTKFV